MKTFKFIENIPPEKWNKLLENSKDAMVFHTLEWQNAICETYPDTKHLFFVLENKSGEIIAGMPIICFQYKIRGVLPIYHYQSSSFGLYGGPVIRDGEDRKACLTRIFKGLNNILMPAEFTIIDYKREYNELEKYGFSKEEYSTHVLKIDNHSEDIFRGLKANVRNKINQALRNPVLIEEIKDYKGIEDYYNIAIATWIKHKRNPPYPMELYKNIYDNMAEKGLVRFHLARYKDNVIAGVVHLLYKSHIYNWLTASYKEYLQLRPNNLLVWSMIKYGSENGYMKYDIGSSPKEGAEGLIEYKKAWGTKGVKYYVWRKTNFTLQKVYSLQNVIQSARKYCLPITPLINRLKTPNGRRFLAWKYLKFPFQPVLEHSFPQMIVIETTNACNLACAHCPRTEVYKSPEKEIGFMEMTLYKKIVDEISQYPSVTIRPFGEGEPLLHPQLPEMIRYAKEKGVFRIWLNTNGILLNEEKSVALLEAGLDELEFSIDAANEKTYHRIKGTSTLNEVIKNVLRYSELKKQILPKAKVIVSFVESDYNRNEKENFINFWESKADKVRIRPCHHHGSLINKYNKSYTLHTRKRLPCNLLWNWTEINYDGSLRFCIWDWKNLCVIGNVKNDSIKNIWNGGKYKELRELHIKRKFGEIPFCAECRDFNHWTW